MKDITLQITVDEANVILEALGNLPFVKVYRLIGKLQEQAGQQLDGRPALETASSPDNPAPTLGESPDA